MATPGWRIRGEYFESCNCDVAHFASRRLATARGTASRFRDHRFSFDNTGRNGHYSAIEWSGG